MSIKHAIRQWVFERGYIFEPKRHLTMLALAERLRQIFADYAIDTVIDVGANEGQYGVFLRNRVGFTGRIESFEPLPAPAEKLRVRAAADGRWSVHQLALGARPGKFALNVAANTVFSSFHKVAEDYSGFIAVAGTAEVAMSTLDAEFFGKRDLRHTYLKLDTQGFDLEVLKGGKQSIAAIPALQTEISFQPLYQGMPGYRESLDAFAGHGFVVADFILAAVNSKHAAMEFDCIMVRPSAISKSALDPRSIP